MKKIKDIGKRIVNYFDLHSNLREEINRMSKEEVKNKVSELEKTIQEKETERAQWSTGRKILAYFDLSDIPPSYLRKDLSFWENVYKNK